jgi:hypothetical protein
VAAGGQPRLGPLQRRPSRSQELVDGGVGLLGVAPGGVVDLVAQFVPFRVAGGSLEQPPAPGSLTGEQRSCLGLVPSCPLDRVDGSSCEFTDHRQAGTGR